MSSHEFTEWQAEFRLDPFGEERDDYRMAIMTCTFANIHGRKKGKRAFTPQDFMPKFGNDTLADRRQSAAEIEATLLGFTVAHNRARENKLKRLGPERARELQARQQQRKDIENGQHSNFSRPANPTNSGLWERSRRDPA
jgi:hypothetical protein